MEFVLLDLHVRYNAGPGESIAVVGDHPALGCWEPAQAITLQQIGPDTGQGDPVWSPQEPISVPQGIAIEYKYLLLVDGRLSRWETFEGNRCICSSDACGVDQLDQLATLSRHGSRAIDAPAAALGSMGDVADSLPVASQCGNQSVHSLGDLEASLQGDAAGAVIVVSYILPLLINQEAGGEWRIEWNQDSIIARKKEMPSAKRVIWVGCPGITVADDAQESLTTALHPFSCVPVFLEPTLQASFYSGFCRSLLWPTFHNVIKAQTFNQKLWRSYCTVNRLFADKVTEVYESGDLIWIHDYHLLLLPSYALRAIRTARMGLFLHTPFPSSEIFRTIPVRDELLRGMLNVDVIGFHLFEYARHFLTCCKRMLGLEYEFQQGGFLGVRDHKRTVLVQVSHAGIEPEVLDALMLDEGGNEGPPLVRSASQDSQEVDTLQAILTRLDIDRAAGVKVIMGIDEIERLKGLPLSLLAYEQLLRSGSLKELGVKVTFVQLGIKARNFTPAVEEDYDMLVSEVADILKRIQGDFPDSIRYVELPTISLQQRLQLWRRADVALFLPIREGLNTYPLEAVFARRNTDPGVVLLSEFASCSRVLNGALRTNPWNTLEVKAILELALVMELPERSARRDRDLAFICHTTARAWAERFVLDLQAIMEQSKVDEQWEPIGFGLAGFRRAAWRSDFTALDTTEVLSAYRRARRRAIFLDWGGTIVPIESNFTSTLVEYYREKLPQNVHQCIEELASDPRNLLMVLSGQERSKMDLVFADTSGASLAAEHGFQYKLGSLPGVRRLSSSGWQQLLEGFDLSWKDTALAVMEAYTARTNASQIQNKGSALVWKFDEVDPEFGLMQAKELRDHLQGMLANFPVIVQMGKGYLEIRPKGINKGVMVDHVVSLLYSHSGGVDFVLCIGDDSADEFMFSALNSRFADKGGRGGQLGGQPSVFTAVVGRKPSAAQYYLNDPDEVLELCQSLRLHSTRANRNRSTSDLQRLAPRRVNSAAHFHRRQTSIDALSAAQSARQSVYAGGLVSGPNSALSFSKLVVQEGAATP